MALFWIEWDYALGLLGWMVTLGFAARWLLQARQRLRLRGALSGRSGTLVHVGLSMWMACAAITAMELLFVLFVDHTESINTTTVSKRWFRRYMDSQRNSDSCRDRRVLAQPLPKGTRRIVLLGDSFAAGHGVRRMEDLFSDRVEQLWNARVAGTPGTPKIWVYNAAEPGYDVTLIEGLLLAAAGPQTDAQVVVYSYMLNDIEGLHNAERGFVADSTEGKSLNILLRRTYFLNWVWQRWSQWSQPKGDYFDRMRAAYAGSTWNRVARKLTNMANICRSNDMEFRLIILPFMHELGPGYSFREAHDKLRVWAASHDVPILDAEPLLSQHANEGLVVNAYDAHPNERAHRLIAEAMEEWLRESPALR